MYINILKTRSYISFQRIYIKLIIFHSPLAIVFFSLRINLTKYAAQICLQQEKRSKSRYVFSENKVVKSYTVSIDHVLKMFRYFYWKTTERE